MHKRDIVVVGTSAGGVEALQTLVQGLPQDYPGTIFVVLHVGRHTVMPEILNRRSKIPVLSAVDGDRFKPNHIYLAPPDRHLLLRDGQIQLSAGPPENGHRPGIDPLFRSAARAHRERVVGVILTGALDDGAAGLYLVKSRNGVAVVQDPNDAIVPSMPLNAMKHVEVDYCLPLLEISALLMRLATGENSETRQIEVTALGGGIKEKIL